MPDLINELRARCYPTCRTCKNKCVFLSQLDVNGLGAVEILLQEGSPAHVPFSCTGCNLCVRNCSRKLNLAGAFLQARQEQVSKMPAGLRQHSPRQVDQPDNVYAAYRQKNRDGSLVPEARLATVAFFPGCALSSFTPQVALGAFRFLERNFADLTWLDGCCGDPQGSFGDLAGAEDNIFQLKSRIRALGIQTLITACPTCHYRLKRALPEIQLLSIYEILKNKGRFSGIAQPFSVHDACPDRFTQSWGQSVRQLLGKELRPLKNEGAQSACCGAGGDVNYSNPGLSQLFRRQRLEEAQTSGAEILAVYCTRCAVQLAGEPDATIRVAHCLDLLLGYETDYTAIAQRIDSFAKDRDRAFL